MVKQLITIICSRNKTMIINHDFCSGMLFIYYLLFCILSELLHFKHISRKHQLALFAHRFSCNDHVKRNRLTILHFKYCSGDAGFSYDQCVFHNAERACGHGCQVRKIK